MKKPFLEIGQLTAPHGIAGEVRLQYWCDSIEVLSELDTLYFDENGRRPVRLLSVRPHKNVAVAALSGVNDRNAAERLRGKILYAKREDIPLPEGSYFIADLIGLRVFDADTGMSYGVLSEVLQPGGNDVYLIKDGEKERLVPVIAGVIGEIDWAENRMEIRPPEGLFDED